MGRIFFMCVGMRDPVWAENQGRPVPFTQMTNQEDEVREGVTESTIWW
jgi:hypothetical protein